MGGDFLKIITWGAGVSNMPSYSTGFKSRMVQRMAGSEGISPYALSAEIGVSYQTLSRWVKVAGKLGAMKNNKPGRKKQRTAEDKMRLVLEAASLSEEDLGEFLRREGLHSHQLEEWKTTATNALKNTHRKKSERTPEALRIRELEAELNRKERALAEAAAILVLKKKLNLFYEEREGNSDTKNET